MRSGLFLRVVSLESRKQMSYRADFWINAVLGFLSELGIAYFLWAAIFAASGESTLGGFTFSGMVLYYVLAILLAKLVRGQERDLSIARDIYEGSLTRYLIYPSSYAFFKYAEHLGGLLPALLQSLFFGAVALTLIEIPADVALSSGAALKAIAVVVVANVLSFLMRWQIQCVAFWADNVWSLNVMLRLATEFFGGLLLPLTLFPEKAQEMLSWSPFPYLFFFPVRTALGQVETAEWLQGLGVMGVWCLVFAATGAWIWRAGQRTYTGVGI